jgi:hypothetical protein
MPNMPSITSAEIAVIGAAVVILYVVPFVLATIDQRRRRRLRVFSSPVMVTEPPAELAAAAPTVDVPAAIGEAAQRCEPDGMSGEESAPTAHEGGAPAAVTDTLQPAAPVTADACAPDTGGPEIAAAIPSGTGTEGPAFEPFAGDAGYQFRLEDLRRVRLPDGADAARAHLGHDAERVAEAHRVAVFGRLLRSPYPVRSACPGEMEQEHSTLRVCYLLFPSLWPASRDQAVAHAVFEIDMETGTVRDRLDALRRCDLSDDARRAIRDSGGDI